MLNSDHQASNDLFSAAKTLAARGVLHPKPRHLRKAVLNLADQLEPTVEEHRRLSEGHSPHSDVLFLHKHDGVRDNVRQIYHLASGVYPPQAWAAALSDPAAMRAVADLRYASMTSDAADEKASVLLIKRAFRSLGEEAFIAQTHAAAPPVADERERRIALLEAALVSIPERLQAAGIIIGLRPFGRFANYRSIIAAELRLLTEKLPGREAPLIAPERLSQTQFTFVGAGLPLSGLLLHIMTGGAGVHLVDRDPQAVDNAEYILNLADKIGAIDASAFKVTHADALDVHFTSRPDEEHGIRADVLDLAAALPAEVTDAVMSRALDVGVIRKRNVFGAAQLLYEHYDPERDKLFAPLAHVAPPSAVLSGALGDLHIAGMSSAENFCSCGVYAPVKRVRAEPLVLPKNLRTAFNAYAQSLFKRHDLAALKDYRNLQAGPGRLPYEKIYLLIEQHGLAPERSGDAAGFRRLADDAGNNLHRQAFDREAERFRATPDGATVAALHRHITSDAKSDPELNRYVRLAGDENYFLSRLCPAPSLYVLKNPHHQPVGLIGAQHYISDKGRHAASIDFSYTAFSERGKGVMSTGGADVRARLFREGAERITNRINPSNAANLAVNRKFGAKVTGEQVFEGGYGMLTLELTPEAFAASRSGAAVGFNP